MTAPTPPHLAPLLWTVDQLASRAMGRPVSVRGRASPRKALRGAMDRMTLGVRDLRVAGLSIERTVVRVDDVTIVPGLEPRIVGGPVQARVTVTQQAVDQWLGRTSVPVRLDLETGGIVSSAGVGPVRVSGVTVDLQVRERALRLRTVGAVGRRLPQQVAELLAGNLPLPRLPAGAELVGVAHEEGRVTVTFDLDDVDEPLDLGAADRVRARLEELET